MEMQLEECSLEKLVDQSGNGSNQLVASHCNDIVNAVVEKEYYPRENREKTREAVHGSKHYQLEHKHDVSGLLYTQGTSRTLWLTPQMRTSITMDTQHCYKLFFPSISVAEVLKTYFGNVTWTRDIARSLSGVQVRLKGPAGTTLQRTIFSLEKTLPAAVDDSQKHAAWLANGSTPLQYPQFPCLNLGSEQRPQLMPPELCTILPMQTFRSPRSPGILRSLQSIRNSESKYDVDSMNTLIDPLVLQPAKKLKQHEAEKLFSQSFANGASQVFFVEVGVDQLFPGSWTKLCEHVAAVVEKKVDAKPTILSLRYFPERSNKGQWEWLFRLKTLCKNHRDTAKGPLLLAVAIQPDQYHRDIYDRLKRLCDVALGVQSFFVNMANVDQKMTRFPEQGFVKAGNELLRRMRIRNPSTPDAAKGPQSTVVAIHVSRIDAHTVGVEDKLSTLSAKVFVVAIVSRDLLTSTRYKTTTHLVSTSAIRSFNLTEFVLEHVQHWPRSDEAESHRLVVLRTGELPVLTEEQLTETVKFDRMTKQGRKHLKITDKRIGNSKDMTEPKGEFQKFAATRDDVDAEGRLPEETKTRVIEREAQLLKEGVECGMERRAFTFAYVHLEEGASVHFSPSSKTAMHEATKKQSDSKAIFFLRDTKLANCDTNQLRAHRKILPQNESKLITLTLLGDKLADVNIEEEPNRVDKPSPEMRPNGTLHVGGIGRPYPGPLLPHTPTPSGKASNFDLDHLALDDAYDIGWQGGDLADDRMFQYIEGQRIPMQPFVLTPDPGYDWPTPRRPSPIRVQKPREVERDISMGNASLDQLKRVVREKEAEKAHAADTSLVPTNISRAEIAILAKLFHDDYLQLYDTKWPVPTYMAHRAAKRAQGRIRHDGYDALEDGAPFTLMNVAPDVERTLYYL